MRNADYFTLYVQPTYVTLVPQYEGAKRSRSNKGHFEKNVITANATHGILSSKAQSKMKNAINWLILAAPKKRVYQKSTKQHFQFKINFITLTLPTANQQHSDTFIKRELLHPWLISVAYKFNLRNYIWKAETTKNGTIHFHITTDTFVHWKDIRRTWNKQLERHGYIDEFESRNGHRDPNSTDVHAVKNVKNLGAYMCKYLTKNDDTRRAITGKLWSASSNLSATNKLTIDSYDMHPSEYNKLCKDKQVKTLVKDFFTIHYFKPSMWFQMTAGIFKQQFLDHLAAIRHNWAESPPLLSYTIP